MEGLKAIGISGYRSFGKHLQLIYPLGKVNVFAGPNNAGKSNILRFIHLHLGQFLRTRQTQTPWTGFDAATDAHTVESSTLPYTAAIGNPIDGDKISSLTDQIRNRRLKPKWQALLRSEVLSKGTDYVWFTKSAIGPSELDVQPRYLKGTVGMSDWEWTELTKEFGECTSNVDQSDLFIRTKLNTFQTLLPPIHFIPAIRKIGEPQSTAGENDFSGSGIIEKLAEFQGPSHDSLHLKEKFASIQSFVRIVTGNDELEIEMPTAKNTIHILDKEKTLPISSYGSGIHEVVMSNGLARQ